MTFAAVRSYTKCVNESRLCPEVRSGEEPRRLAVMRCLLKGISKAEQDWLAPRRAEERETYWQAEHLARRNGDMRIAGNRGRTGGAAADGVVAIDQIDGPGRPACRPNERIQLVLLHYCVDALGTAEAVVLLQRVQIPFCGQRPLRLRFYEGIL